MTRSVKTYYEVVWGNGSGVYATVHGPLNVAKARAERIAATYSIPIDDFELQMVAEYDGRSRRYFVREGSTWVLWDGRRDANERRPDWRWSS